MIVPSLWLIQGERLVRWLLFGASRQGWLTDFVLFLLRAFTGLALALGRGVDKLGSTGEFEMLIAEAGVPVPGVFAWMSLVAEAVGGLFLAAGLLTRFWSLCIAGNMVFLLVVRHQGHLFGTGEAVTFYLLITLVFFILGSGRFSVDALFRRRRR